MSGTDTLYLQFSFTLSSVSCCYCCNFLLNETGEDHFPRCSHFRTNRLLANHDTCCQVLF